MKKLILSAAFATLLASPVLAQSYTPDYGTGNIVPQVATGADITGSVRGAYAYEPSRVERFQRETLRARGPNRNILLQEQRDLQR